MAQIDMPYAFVHTRVAKYMQMKKHVCSVITILQYPIHDPASLALPVSLYTRSLWS